MPEQRPPTKADLLGALRSSGEEFLATLRGLPPDRFEEGRYEGGWNGRQILAHVAAIEWTYPKLLEIPAQAPPSAGSHEPPSGAVSGGIDAYNERQVARRADVPVADLLAEFERNRATTIAAVETVGEELLAKPIRSAGGITGPLGQVFHAVAVEHVLGHMRDIAGAT